jgi:hypothetical protein
MPAAKELHHFGSDITAPQITRIVRDPDAYAAHFAAAARSQPIGEASPYLLYSERAPAEILRASPDARIIISLRDPAEMIHSMHQARLNSGRLHEGQENIADLAVALSLEADRARGHAMPPGAPTDPSQTFYLRYRFLARYAPHARRWIDAFGRERVHVIPFDDLARDAAGVFRRLCSFIGVEERVPATFAAHNRGRRTRAPAVARWLNSAWLRTLLPRSVRSRILERFYRLAAAPPPALDPVLRERIAGECEADVRELADLTGIDLRKWMAG